MFTPVNCCYGIKKEDVWKNIKLSIEELDEVTYPKITFQTPNRVTVKKVVFNPPATIIIWNDGSKSVVKAQNGEPFDPEKGFVMAYLKKLLGNDNTFNKEITKWVKYEEPTLKNKPLTTKQIRKLDGKRLWLVPLNGNCEEFFTLASGWHTVNVEKEKLFDDVGNWYCIEDNKSEYGFHAYLEEPGE